MKLVRFALKGLLAAGMISPLFVDLAEAGPRERRAERREKRQDFRQQRRQDRKDFRQDRREDRQAYRQDRKKDRRYFP